MKFLKGNRTTEVVSADSKGLQLETTEKNAKGVVRPVGKQKLTWNQFYMKNKGQLNRMIIELVEKGRATCHTPPLRWSQQMLGAAMTMQTLYADDPNVPKRVAAIVKKAASEFEPCKKYAEKMFPDVEGVGEASDKEKDE